MLNIKGITEAKADKCYEIAQKLESMSFITGMQVMEKRKQLRRISTGSTAFD
jgi:meiotic recombination protein DMC1